MTFLNLSSGARSFERRSPSPGSLGSSGHGSSWRAIRRMGASRSSSTRSFHDEFSFVLEGRWGFQLGSDVVYAEPGDLVYKPRDVWHTFWNATDTPARLLEIISPAGFEQLFVELADLLRTDPGNLESNAALGAKYGVESDLEATARVVGEHGLIERLG
jgi:Cupin domain